MSSSDERSPKRQRRSYSPASPPAAAAETKPFVQPPQTPPPSVHMSPSWQTQQLPGLGMQGGAGSVTFPTPPSTAGFQSQMMARGASSESGGVDSGQQTPAAENDSMPRTDAEGDAQMSDTQQEGAEGDVTMTEDAEHRRTDHEREEGEDVVPPLPESNALHKLFTEPVPPSRPHPSQDLIELYSLQRIQQSVARNDPVTGLKINKLRRSYEGKVKALGLEGRSKAVKGSAELEGLADSGWMRPLEDGRTWWENHIGETMLGEHNPDKMLALLGPALDMRPGNMPKQEHEHWKGQLGLDESVVNISKPTTNPLVSIAPKTATSAFLSKTAPGAAMRSSAPASPRNLAARPERAGKKRRYDESSYAGYQEGYEDDGYSTGGMDDAGGRRGSVSASKRQKRKVSGRQTGYYAQENES